MSAAPRSQGAAQAKLLLSETDLNAVQLAAAQLVGSGQRVLVVGSITDVLLRQLRSQECEISMIDRRRRAALSGAALCERVLVGDVEHLNPVQEFGNGSFDCIVAVGLLEFAKDPEGVLVRLKQCLPEKGFLVTSVPNTSHGGMRLGFLQDGQFGLSPHGAGGPTQTGHYDRKSLESLLDKAGFALGRLERHRIPIEASLSPENLAWAPPDLLTSLSNDPEARTSHFIALAYPLPNLSLDWLREQMRRLAKENDAARRELADLRPLPQRLARAEEGIAVLRETVKTKEKRHDTVRAELAAATAQVENLAQKNQILLDELTSNEATHERLLDLSAQVKHLSDENRRLSQDLRLANAERETARRVEEERDGLQGDFEKALRREKNLRDELVRFERTAARVRELEDTYRAAEEQIRAVEASPGWRLISSYRGWLSRHVWTRPWLRKPYEALAARLLPGADPRQGGASGDPVGNDSVMAGELATTYIELLSDSGSFVDEDDLRFALESPPAGTVPVRGTIEIRGWAIALEGVSSVTLRVDDGPELSTDYGRLRRDVARQHSEFPDASRSGFRFRWDTTETPDGVHRLRTSLETETGRRRELTRDVLVDQRDPYDIWIERNEPSSLDKRVMRDDLDSFAYQPTISVLTPIYKTPLELLSACVESVMSQIYDNWELSLVDDGSADPQLSALLEQLQRRDSRIKVKTLASNGGIAAATNAALAMCRGEYVAFLDHDDELADFALFEVVRKLNESPRPDVIYSDEDKIDREGFEGSQDFDLVLRLAEHTQAIKRADGTTGFSNQTGRRISSTQSTMCATCSCVDVRWRWRWVGCGKGSRAVRISISFFALQSTHKLSKGSPRFCITGARYQNQHPLTFSRSPTPPRRGVEPSRSTWSGRRRREKLVKQALAATGSGALCGETPKFRSSYQPRGIWSASRQPSSQSSTRRATQDSRSSWSTTLRENESPTWSSTSATLDGRSATPILAKIPLTFLSYAIQRRGFPKRRSAYFSTTM